MAGAGLLVQFVAEQLQLPEFELGNPNPAPGFGGAQQGREHQRHHGPLAERVRNHL